MFKKRLDVIKTSWFYSQYAILDLVGNASEVETALEGLDFSGKRVRVVSIHEGSGLANMPSDVKKMCKGANVEMSGLAIIGSQAKNSKQKVAEWV